MFDRTDLAAFLAEERSRDLPPIEEFSFDQDDFSDPSSEESVLIYRTGTLSKAQAMSVWVRAVETMSNLPSAREFNCFAASALFQPIEQARYEQIVSAKMPSKTDILPDADGLQSAMLMYDDWNYCGLIACFDDAQVVFFWETTA